MKILEEKILSEGIAVNEDILKVDSFVNHQVDPVPMIILKKQPSKVLNDNLYQTVVTSFTKGTSYELTLSQQFINENDHVLIVDDFLANGEAATGAIRLLRKAHATIAGVGILIEKSFQPGRGKLMEQGLDVYSLARISKLGKDLIEFIPEEE